ncbi:hypothetical protein FD02_GL001452 [Lacticaseibacillus nasuensis JCM 17158]|uniref:Uncharacterized protein n=1 Tax=Lacticaseibacillus nasuensis JCM 17158 TaxID=1291734 RepID=A0A0R1JLW1_9LACO|nr:hypothetical protein FD02_GL001452 [Lacticaseibacillus nasuensis JCM 17158]
MAPTAPHSSMTSRSVGFATSIDSLPVAVKYSHARMPIQAGNEYFLHIKTLT